jgi:predicted peroxiredoxin
MSITAPVRQRVAVVIYEDASKDLARAYRGLMTAVEFLEAGDDVTVVYDGSGVDTLAAASALDPSCTLWWRSCAP